MNCTCDDAIRNQVSDKLRRGAKGGRTVGCPTSSICAAVRDRTSPYHFSPTVSGSTGVETSYKAAKSVASSVRVRGPRAPLTLISKPLFLSPSASP